ncbi:nucleic acid dioxygenase ALKBH1 [Aplysia californica]|uniref:Nucleic acid dioxygenase ALKBH1 n=1 Tax=Aplysia californica TaxID=6500 RepID=A0ABM1VRZ6_APLCA|nr:nucleic acid dioxygenase ALKBH1 [Aplysia californica]XP_005096743.1 nucleic acid dioxygenase ALKBH1 [Aplysia californica]XP_005096745.1 nucleic acid dioxygenase ALKBH1 [Aplysia californica]XP_005096746.1 nucleic acid dioxygenase ALKBH1 [Aplysia californica]XP_005096747.1 nucleic acid dioxygenase ALKBH1 [Aplysia californica]XP_035825188.1 nucleic acid dioxygenase ALKBH1 [Aplysia californica]
MADVFTPEFKRLKAKHPPPDHANVLDLTKQLGQEELVEKYGGAVIEADIQAPHEVLPLVGLKPCESWKAYKFRDFSGFILILNPFIDGFQRYWVARCLRDLPRNPENVTNLSALGGQRGEDLWSEFAQKSCSTLTKQDPLRKLRWTTLGYHYNWTTKEYSEANKAEFPPDVACLSQYLARCMGFGQYRPEAAIVNYYHLDSTLAGHTDHSELDQAAPLFSISFGQSAIFMLGGAEKSTPPMSLMLHSGDICIMSGSSRLSYHAVPKILAPPAEQPVPKCFSLHPEEESLAPQSSETCGSRNAVTKDAQELDSESDAASGFSTTEQQIGNSCSNDTCLRDSVVKDVNESIKHVMSSLEFKPFEVYITSSRINLNIRQVLPPGFDQLPKRLAGRADGKMCSGDNCEGAENQNTFVTNHATSCVGEEPYGAMSDQCSKNEAAHKENVCADDTLCDGQVSKKLKADPS